MLGETKRSAFFMNVWKHNSEEEGIEMLEKEGRDQRKGKKNMFVVMNQRRKKN